MSILSDMRPWYRHPKWHFWHWQLQVHIWQSFKRWAFDRCSKCGKGFHWGESVIGDWSGKRIWHGACDTVNLKPSTERQNDNH
jgi:hypothetical protein